MPERPRHYSNPVDVPPWYAYRAARTTARYATDPEDLADLLDLLGLDAHEGTSPDDFVPDARHVPPLRARAQEPRRRGPRAGHRPRGVCPVCGREWALKYDGTVGWHEQRDEDGRRVGACEGVGHLLPQRTSGAA